MLRPSPRALALWVAAGAVAATTAAVVASDLASLHERVRELGPERAAVVATRDLTLGTKVEARDLAVRRVHVSQVPDDVLRSAADARGRVVQVPVLQGAFVAARNLAPRDRTGLGAAVPPGMRAVRVVVRDGLVPRRGDLVDVLATFPPGTRSPSGPSGATVVVAVRAVVLDVDGTTSGLGSTDSAGVSLLVTEEEAHDVAEAAANGTVALALAPAERSGTHRTEP